MGFRGRYWEELGSSVKKGGQTRVQRDDFCLFWANFTIWIIKIYIGTSRYLPVAPPKFARNRPVALSGTPVKPPWNMRGTSEGAPGRRRQPGAGRDVPGATGEPPGATWVSPSGAVAGAPRPYPVGGMGATGEQPVTTGGNREQTGSHREQPGATGELPQDATGRKSKKKNNKGPRQDGGSQGDKG